MNQLLTKSGQSLLSEQQISHYLQEQILHNHPKTSLLTEFNFLRGATRIDHLLLDEQSLHGIEIKSDLDDLHRLKRQINQYMRIVEFLTIVGTPQNIMRITKLLPDKVGLLMVYPKDGQLRHVVIRAACPNPNRCPLSLAQLLWKQEAIELLRSTGHRGSLAGLPRQQLWQQLSLQSDLPELSEQVVRLLKKRHNKTTLSKQKILTCSYS